MKKLGYLIFLIVTYLAFSCNIKAYENDYGRDNNIYIGKSIGVHIPSLATFPIQFGYFLTDRMLLGLEKGERSIGSIDDGNFILKSASYENKGIWSRYYTTVWNINWILSYNQYELNLEAEARVDDAKHSGLEYGSKVNGELEAISNVMCAGGGFSYGYNRFLLGLDIAAYCSNDSKVSAEAGNGERDQDLKEVGEFVNDLSGSHRYLMVYFGVIF